MVKTTTYPHILISSADMRHEWPKYLKLLKEGQEVFITVRGEVVAKLSPVKEQLTNQNAETSEQIAKE